jgi:ABC-2 type transport system ATP-binding protein
MNVIESAGLGKRYGRAWALRDCSLAIPGGHVVALVGPNGAGKTTLLSMAVGLTTPTAGSVSVLGGDPAGSPDALDRIAFVAQDAPLYKNLPVADMLHLARNLNRRWDQQYAEVRLRDLGIPLGRKVGKLSGGQQSQLALTVALARRPDLLVLDEPLAMLDPVARDDFMASVQKAVAETDISVVLSSHVLAELERMADYLIVLSRGQVQVAGEVGDLLAGHRMLTGPAAESGELTGPAAESGELPGRMRVVQRRLAGAQSQLLIRTTTPAEPAPPGWQSRSVGLEELVLAYLRESGAAAMPGLAEVQADTRTEVQA